MLIVQGLLEAKVPQDPFSGEAFSVKFDCKGIGGQTPVLDSPYMGTSLIRKRPPLGPYSRSRVVLGGGRFLMSEVPLYRRLGRLYS